ncbi:MULTISPECIES: hypothetical protein [unclassified Caballeronia]|uniref:hypothetical protein n=1 Tax=unclassified Caballeronia TaxID=2646786 RepID=UPI0028668180|nr:MULTISPECIES: hypothetical protein [unclassified Caballeronia]MDR5741276.1 hypothetical protein [Caballeronia sp. LZ016]MDR5807174.1 hypothetical protein [Caballeronia sp. LZ019]
MNQVHADYRGFVITPLAAFDDGLYTSMLILRDKAGRQRATGMLGQFASANEACQFALAVGMEEIDRQMALSSD